MSLSTASHSHPKASSPLSSDPSDLSNLSYLSYPSDKSDKSDRSDPSDQSDQSAFDDNSLALRELSLDRMFPRIRPEDYQLYIARSLEIGRTAAATYLGRPPRDIAELLKVRIVYFDAELQGAFAARSEYDSGTQTIALYRYSIAALQARLNEFGMQTDQTAAADIHIAHELFHHLEATLLGRVDHRLPSVSVWTCGSFRLGRAPIRRCREIAAHKFAKDLLGLPFLPNALDLMMEVGPKTFYIAELGVCV